MMEISTMEPLMLMRTPPLYNLAMADFELVHGAWHSAAHWNYLIAELNKLGHDAQAVDLPIDTHTMPEDWAQTVAEHIGDRHDVQLVGHSMAGLILTRVAEIVPVKHTIYIAGILQRPGYSLAEDMTPGGPSADLLAGEFGAGVEFSDDGFLTWIDPIITKAAFYQDCSPEVADEAFAQLRPQIDYIMDVAPQAKLTRVPVHYVTCKYDQIINPSWSGRVPKQLLGVKPVSFPAGHSPFLSKPKQFASLLSLLAHNPELHTMHIQN